MLGSAVIVFRETLEAALIVAIVMGASRGVAARGRQIATLTRLAHEKFIAPDLGKLLDDLQPYAESLPYESDEASLVRVARRLYERKSKVPPQFTAEFENHTAAILEVWKQARPADDFAKVQPYLEKTLEPGDLLYVKASGRKDPTIDTAFSGVFWEAAISGPQPCGDSRDTG